MTPQKIGKIMNCDTNESCKSINLKVKTTFKDTIPVIQISVLGWKQSLLRLGKTFHTDNDIAQWAKLGQGGGIKTKFKW